MKKRLLTALGEGGNSLYKNWGRGNSGKIGRADWEKIGNCTVIADYSNSDFISPHGQAGPKEIFDFPNFTSGGQDMVRT